MTTQWSVVLRAGAGDKPQARAALEQLCAIYWYPVYAYVRRRGHSPDQAKDLTQEFFARLLQRNWLATADRDKGRFRSFLLGAVNHFLADAWDKSHAQKRGGNVVQVPLVTDNAETRFSHEPVDNATPETLYERRWALTLLSEVLDCLHQEYEKEGRAELFRLLNPCLVGDRTSQRYSELAVALRTTEGTVKAAVHRLRQRYRQLLREAVAGTVAEPCEIDDEMRHLLVVLARG